MERAQATIELLLAVAGLLAFIAILAPSISLFSQRALLATQNSQVEYVFETIVFHADKVAVLGNGSRLELEVKVPTSCVLETSDSLVSLSCGGGSFKKNSLGNVAPSKIELPAGSQVFVFANSGGVVLISLK